MDKRAFSKLFAIILCTAFMFTQVFSLALVPQDVFAEEEDTEYNSPFDVGYSPDGSMIAVTNATKGQLEIVNASDGSVLRSVKLEGTPKGLAWSDGFVYVAEYGAYTVAEIDAAAGDVVRRFNVGPKAIDVAVAKGGEKLVVADYGLSNLTVIDLATGQNAGVVDLGNNYPFTVEVTVDGNYALVGYELPSGNARDDDYSTSVTFVDVDQLTVTKDIKLTNGAANLKDIVFSPDGKYAYVSHTLGKNNLPTTHITKGWVITNAVSIIDAQQQDYYTTFILDRMTAGAADPWGITISNDSNTLWVSASGTHQVIKVDVEQIHYLLEGNGPSFPSSFSGGVPSYFASHGPDLARNMRFRSKQSLPAQYRSISDVWLKIKDDPANADLLKYDLGALWGIGALEVIDLPGQGPRGISASPDGTSVAVGAYFAGEVYTIDAVTNKINQTIDFGGQPKETPERSGERTFYDGTLSIQGWLSCVSCHPNARADGNNWDTPDDGIGNPKNTKPMLGIMETAPMLSHGGKPNGRVGIYTSFEGSLGVLQSEDLYDDVQAYIEAMEPEVSPYRNPDGTLTEDAVAGKAIFESEETQCASCHNGPYFTDLQTYNVGTRMELDTSGDFDNPMLIELWRTAPYLHDGSAATVMDVLTTRNPDDLHGKTSHLSQSELEQLEAYLLQLGFDTQVPAKDPVEVPAPTAPGNLEAVEVTDTTVTLAWEPSQASSEKNSIVEYNIYNKGEFIGWVPGSETTYTVVDLVPGTEYVFTVKAKDILVNLSEDSNAVEISTGIIYPPTAPTNLTVVDKTDTTVTLEWGAATHEIGVTQYNIYRGNTLVGSVSGTDTSYTVTDLTQKTEYTFKVTALDATEKESEPSNEVTVTTDVTVINIALGKPADASSEEGYSQSTGTYQWIENGNDGDPDTRWCANGEELPQWWRVDLEADYRITGYKIQWEDTPSWFDGDQVYKYRIEVSDDDENWTVAYDMTGNTSTDLIHEGSIEATGRYVRVFITGKATNLWASFHEFEVYGVLNEAPSAPANLTASNIGPISATLSWDESTHIAEIEKYNIYRDGTLIDEVPATQISYTATQLLPNTDYTFTVTAEDVYGNESGASNEVTFTTPLQPVNVALKKPAQASSEEGFSDSTQTYQYIHMGNDGDLDTRWCSADGDLPQWWMVDLEEEYDLIGSKIVWEASRSGETAWFSYYIEVSKDGNTWTEVVNERDNRDSTPSGVNRVDEHTFSATGRFVRITITNKPGNMWSSFHEFEVYSFLGATEPLAPSAPTNLESTDKTETSVSLAWDLSADDENVEKYNIYVDGELTGSVSAGTSTYTVTELTANTTYTFTVTAEDGDGNESEASNAITVTTDVGSSDPIPTNVALRKPATASYVYQSNEASYGNDGDASTRWRGSDSPGNWWQVDLGSEHKLVGSKVYWDLSNIIYQYKIEVSSHGEYWTTVVDKTGNAETKQTEEDTFEATGRYIRVTIVNIGTQRAGMYEFEAYGYPTETTSAPTNLALTNVTGATASLAWGAPTDSNFEVAAYRIYRDGILRGTVSGSVTSYVVTGLTPETSYEFTVIAVDSDGNESEPSLPLTVTTVIGRNIALGKPAAASSQETQNPAQNGNDGSLTTRWCANSGSVPQWWRVDLGEETDISGTQVTWEYARLFKYRIEVSDDAQNWTVVVDKTDNTDTSQVQVDRFSASARYVRIVITSVPAQPVTWASFFEFAVFEDETPPAPEFPLEITEATINKVGGISVQATVSPKEPTDGTVIFKLMKGSIPVAIVATKDKIEAAKKFTAQFPSYAGDDYSVKVFVWDKLDNTLEYVGIDLALPEEID